MDFYSRKETSNLSHFGIREIDFDCILGIKSSIQINKIELSKVFLCKKINLSYNKIIILLNIPNKVESLDISHNLLKELTNLPEELKILRCISNKISNLDNLPNKLTHLDQYLKLKIKVYMLKNLLTVLLFNLFI